MQISGVWDAERHPAASKPREDVAGRTEEPRRKAGMVGDVEVDEPLHGAHHTSTVAAGKVFKRARLMTWLLRALFAMLPAVAWADMPPIDPKYMIGGLRLEMTLSPGLGIGRPQGQIRFRNFSPNVASPQPREEAIPLILDRATRRDGMVTYRFVVPKDAQARAAAFLDHHDGIPSFVPVVNLCRMSRAGNREHVEYRLYRPGYGNTPMQPLGPAYLRQLLPKMLPCPAP